MPSIRALAFVPLILALTTMPTLAPAQSSSLPGQSDLPPQAQLVPRQPVPAGSLVTRQGDVVLLLNGSDVTLQFTDSGLQHLMDGTGGNTNPTSNSLIGQLLGSFLRDGVKAMLDRAIAYPLSGIDRAEYANGRLLLYTTENKPLYVGWQVNGRQIMDQFPEEQAREFAARLAQAKAGHTAR